MIAIRNLKNSDREEFLSMVEEFYSGDGVLHTVKREVFERSFEEMMRSNEYLESFIFEYDGEICGYGMLSYSFAPEVGGKSIFIEEIFVKEKYRSKGIGRAFLTKVLENLDGNFRRIRLEAVRTNDRAISLYRKYGFETLDYMQMVVDRP